MIFLRPKKKIQSKRRGANTVLPDSVIFFCRHAIFFLNFFFAFFSHFRARTFFILLFSSFFFGGGGGKTLEGGQKEKQRCQINHLRAGNDSIPFDIICTLLRRLWSWFYYEIRVLWAPWQNVWLNITIYGAVELEFDLNDFDIYSNQREPLNGFFCHIFQSTQMCNNGILIRSGRRFVAAGVAGVATLFPEPSSLSAGVGHVKRAGFVFFSSTECYLFLPSFT